jgi:hypothetical protein
VSLQQDFILRAIRQLAEAVARALGAARAGEPEQALLALDRSIGTGLGLPLSLLLKLTPQSFLSVLGRDKALAALDALRARADILDQLGQAAEATECRAMVRAVSAQIAGLQSDSA